MALAPEVIEVVEVVEVVDLEQEEVKAQVKKESALEAANPVAHVPAPQEG